MSDRKLERRLRALRDPSPSPDLEIRLTQGIPASFAEKEPWWNAGRIRTMVRIGAVTAAVAVAVWVLVFLVGPGGVSPSWAEMLKPVAQASGGAGPVHMVLNMLTRGGEDFDYVELKGQMQTVEAWVQWPRDAGDPGRMRVDKPGRVYCFDGRQTLLYKPGQREAYRHDGGSPRLQMLWPAAWVQKLLDLPEGARIQDRHEAEGHGHLLLRWDGRPAEGREPAFFDEFDREVEIQWDLATQRLTGFRRWVDVQGQRRLISELVSIEYPGSLGDEIFRLDLPADVRWGGLAQGPAAFDALGPREAAERFWRAAVDGDWETVAFFCPSPATVDWLKENRPTELLTLGEPFRSGSYAGVYVPYKVRFGGASRGEIREYRMALRNDNEYGRWVEDGGI